MDHAEVREIVESAALEPRRLRDLLQGAGLDGAAVEAHLRSCPACAAESHAWLRTGDAMVMAMAAGEAETGGASSATGTAGEAAEDALAVRAPADLRDRTLAYVRARGVPRGAAASPAFATEAAAPRTSGAAQADRGAVGRHAFLAPVADAVEAARAPRQARPFARRAWLLAAAAVVVMLAGGAAIGLDLAGQRDAARAESGELTQITASVDSLLRQPDRQIVALSNAATGEPAGSITWSDTTGQLIVMSRALKPPAAGTSYRCWVERNGKRTMLGQMWFVSDVAFWTGPLSAWGGSVTPGSTFGVSLVPTTQGPGQAVLVGSY